MSHTYAQNVVHVVFSTKGRLKAIDPEFQPKLRAYVAGICKKAGIYLHSSGGTEDHLHLLIQVPAVLSLSKVVATIKSNSSRWANEEGHRLAWQQGYGAFSVSASVIPVVDRYIQNQEEHHKKRSFDEELVALLKKHGVEFDPKYVSDRCRTYGAHHFLLLSPALTGWAKQVTRLRRFLRQRSERRGRRKMRNAAV